MQLYEKINGGQVYVIAEMSANHAGNLDTALEIVHAAKQAGADCLKIQTYTADTLTIDCNNSYFRISGGLWDGYKLYDLYKGAEMPWEWQNTIKSECKRIDLDFLSTPFDRTAVDFLEESGCEAYKIASFELVDIPLIEYVASKGKPILLSCGMGSLEEIQDAVDACSRQGNDKIILLKCCSEYPANYKDMNLATIADMRERFRLPVGLSDHSMGTIGAVVGVSLGACVVEKHFCLDRRIKSADNIFSMESAEFADMVKDIRAAAEIRGQVCYDLAESEKVSIVFRRSLFAIKDIEPGEVFTEQNIRCIRPGYGIAPKYLLLILGKRAGRFISRGTPIDFGMW